MSSRCEIRGNATSITRSGHDAAISSVRSGRFTLYSPMWVPGKNWLTYVYLNLYGFFYMLGADAGELNHFFTGFLPNIIENKAPDGTPLQCQHVLANYGCGSVDPKNPFKAPGKAEGAWLWDDMQFTDPDTLDVYADAYLETLPRTIQRAFSSSDTRATMRRLLVNAVLLCTFSVTNYCDTKLSSTTWRKRFGYNPRYWSMGTTCKKRQERGCFWNGHGGMITGLHDGMLYTPGSTPAVGVSSRPKDNGRATCCHKKYKGNYFPPGYEEQRWRRAEEVLRWFYAKRFGKRRTEYLICALMGWEGDTPPILLPASADASKPAAAREIAGPWYASVAAMMESVAELCQQMPADFYLKAFAATGLSIPTWKPESYPRAADPAGWLFLPNVDWGKLRELLVRLVEARNAYYVSVGRCPTGARAPTSAWKPIEQFLNPTRMWSDLAPPPTKRASWLPSTPVLVVAGVAAAGAAYLVWKGSRT